MKQESQKISAALKNPQSSLLEAVLTIIVKGGVDAVRYRSVADEAGVSLGTVSYHFKSREELLRAALTYYLEENVRQMLNLRKKYNAKNLHEIALYLVEVCKQDFKNKNKRVFAEYELMVYAARDPLVAHALENYENAMIGELARELETAGLKQPFMAAKTLAEMIRGFELKGLGLAKLNFDEFRDRIFTVLNAYKTGDTHD